MEKGQSPIFAELTLADIKDYKANPACKFTGTDNPRYLRVIQALLLRPRKREDIDRISGAANGPDLMWRLRKLGLCAPCAKVPGIDLDGRTIKFGVYSLDDDDRRKLKAWLRLRDARGAA
jgi:hypothetical protein